MDKKFTNMLLQFVGALSLIAIVIALCFRFGAYGEQLKINDFLGYTASFGGAILGSMTSLVILYITIINSKKDYEDTKLNAVMPILKICKDLNSQQYDFVLDADNITEFGNIKEDVKLKIKNIGVGTARDIKIKFNNNYVTNRGKVINMFDLGANENTNFIIRIGEIQNIAKELNKDTYIPIIIEYVDVYRKRKYEHYLKVIKLQGYSSFEIYENEKVDITEL
ncbi:hypothetical protein [Clostridium sp. YIM B02569]|uniref:hypothetical protein n=1 Tax=Clostridium sp. YIM B02569 TaxID=2911967 RepID=UPI001EEA39A8|nr:hypothetical protein [Clostridium sp. YIM B02569]